MPRRLFFLAFLCALLAAAAPPVFAAPPRIEVAGPFGGDLVQNRWQPLVVTLTNEPSGDAVQGEVQVALEDPRSGGTRLATYTRGIAMPRGASRAQASVLVHIPDGLQPDIAVYVVSNGQIVTRKRFDKFVAFPSQITVLAVSDTPDALAYLRGSSLGFVHRDGALRPLPAVPRPPGFPNPNAPPAFPAGPVVPTDALVKVNSVAPAALPDRSLGYDAVGIVYLGDVPPDAFSDAQVAALRAWVASGGLLVASGPRLAGDERFRAWLPARWQPPTLQGLAALGARYGSAPPAGITVMPLTPLPGTQPIAGAGTGSLASGRRLGRGAVVALGFDAAAPVFGGWSGAGRFWKEIAAQGVGPRSVGYALQNDDGSNWSASMFRRAVVRAQGLKAPSFGSIGLFLLCYLVLLVPVNYAVLKRMDRREWTWLTVPLLVVLFSAGAYSFGYAIKGGRMLLNTAAIVEMAPGDGAATILGSAGLFSPRRTSYDVSLAQRDALLFGPDPNDRMPGSEYGPLLISQDNGATARDADVSMWAMRVFGVRMATRWGDGLDVQLSEHNGRLQGTVRNRTGHALQDVTLMVPGQALRLGDLAPGQTGSVTVSALRLPSGRSRFNNGFNTTPWGAFGGSGMTWGQSNTIREAIRQDVRNAVINTMASRTQTGDEAGAVITAWNYEPVLPLQVDARPVTAGEHVNLIVVTIPAASLPRR